MPQDVRRVCGSTGYLTLLSVEAYVSGRGADRTKVVGDRDIEAEAVPTPLRPHYSELG